MAVTRIKNNQITDSTITFQKIASGTLVGSLFNANLTLNSNVSIAGNLTVTGNTTTINSIDTLVSDNLITLNNGYVGIPAYDVGVLFNRSLGTLENYGGVNAALVWSESDGAFIVVLTTETGTTAGTIDRKFQANLIAGNVTVSNAATIQTARITNLSVSGVTAVSGNLVAASGTNATNYTTGALVVPNGGGVGITGDLWVQGPSTFAGNIIAGNIQLSGNINVPIGGTFSNTGVFFGNAGGIGALYAGTSTYTALPTTVLQMSGNVNTYAQVNFQNINSGTEASTDLVLTADNGDDTDGYINLGINSSTFNDPDYPIFGPNDGYLINHGINNVGNLLIVNHAGGPANGIGFSVGGFDLGNVKMQIYQDGVFVTANTQSTSIFTGALIVAGGMAVKGNIHAAAINATPIGNTSPSSGYFTTLNATNASSGNIVISGGYISALTNAYVTTGRTENFSTANAVITGGNISLSTGNDTTFVTADNVEGFDAKFGNLLVEAGASFPNIYVTGGTVTGLTNFATSFGNIYSGYLDNVAIGANVTGPASFTTANASGIVNITNATQTTSTSTGALTITGGAGIGKNLYVGGNAVVAGNLVVLGTTTSVDSVDLVVKDSSIKLHTFANGAPLTTNDGRDIGVLGNYYTNADKYFFFGQKNSSGFFEYYADATEDASNVVTGTYGTIKSGQLIISNSTSSNDTITGAITVAGGVGVAGNLWAGTIYAGSINATPIGNATASTGAFTTITATSTLTVAGVSTLNSLLVNNEAKAATINGTANVYLAPQSGSATVTINPLVIGAIDNMSIGATAAANAYVSNFRATTSLFAAPTGTVWLRGGTGTSGINNIPIGAVTPSTGTFTTAESQTLNVTNGNVTTLVATNLSSGNIVATGVTLAEGNLVANATTSSTNTTTGALVVRGGAGIGGAVNIGGQIVTTAAGSATDGAGQLYLNGATSNRIDWAAVGTGAPALTTRSAGTKVVLYPSLSASNTDYAIGIDAATMWSSVPENGSSFNFKWYGAATEVASLSGIGTLKVVGNIVASSGTASTSTTTGALVVVGGVGVSGNLTIGGNINSPANIVVNSTKSAATDFTVRGANENSLLFVHSDSTYDQVVISGNITASNVTQGAKLVIASTDSLLVPVGTSAQRPGAVGFTDVDGMLRFNSTTNALEFYGDGQWNTTGSTFTTILSRTFSNSSGDLNGNVDGINTQFSLASNSTTAGTLVSISGVLQIPTTAYTVTGNVVTFTEAPAIGDIVDTRIITTTQTVTAIASTSGFNQFLTDDTALRFYTGNVSLGSVENWRIDTHGDFYPVSTANIGYSNNRVDYFYVSNINVSGTISGASLSSGSLDDTVIGANIARLGAFTSLFANSTFTTNAEHVTDDIRGKFVSPGGTDAVYGFAIATYRSGKFFVQLTDENGGEYQAAEVIAVHNGTTCSIEIYGVTFTGAANLATFSSNISAGTAYLNASSAGANLKIKVTPTLMKL